MSSDKIEAGTITLTSGRGDEIEAYHARPVDAESYGSVVVIHHMPGYDSSTKEIARRFASREPQPVTVPRRPAPRVGCPTPSAWRTSPARWPS